jgi:single-stranded DNA-binding protein
VAIEAAFIGVLGRDGEVKNSSRGKSYLKLNLRVAEGDDAQWVSTLSFDPDAIAQAGCFSKGVKIYVDGRISLSEWQDQAGAKRTGLSRLANLTRLVAIGRNRARDTRDDGQERPRMAASRQRDDARRSAPVRDDQVPDDDIPF